MKVFILLALMPFWAACAAQGVHEVAGVFEAGFEASALYPCSEPSSQWWVNGSVLFERYDALVAEDSTAQPWAGPAVFVQVRGQLSPSGAYGHMDAYQRELTVRDLVRMERIDREPTGDRAAWVQRVCEASGF